MIKAPLLLALLLAAAPARAADWTIDPKASEIRFSGKHAGRDFTGVFTQWSGTISFDPDKLGSARVAIDVKLGSASTGNATYDKTLPGADWLNVEAFPTAHFAAQSIQSSGKGKYVAQGTLSIRGVNAPVTLPFSLDIKGDHASMTGSTTLKRVTWGIGKGPDASGTWVTLDIPVSIKVSAKRAAAK